LEKEVRLACSHTPLASTDHVSPVEGIVTILTTKSELFGALTY